MKHTQVLAAGLASAAVAPQIGPIAYAAYAVAQAHRTLSLTTDDSTWWDTFWDNVEQGAEYAIGYFVGTYVMISVFDPNRNFS